MEYKLSRYMIKIVNEYLDYSIQNIENIFVQSEDFIYKLKSDMTIREILILCARLSTIGF